MKCQKYLQCPVIRTIIRQGMVAGCWVGSSLPRLLNMVHNTSILNSSCYVLSMVGRMDQSPFYQPRTKCNTNYSKYWKCGPYSTTEANLNPPNSQLPHRPWCQPLSCLQTQQCSVTLFNVNTHNSVYANQLPRISDAWSNLA